MQPECKKIISNQTRFFIHYRLFIEILGFCQKTTIIEIQQMTIKTKRDTALLRILKKLLFINHKSYFNTTGSTSGCSCRSPQSIPIVIQQPLHCQCSSRQSVRNRNRNAGQYTQNTIWWIYLFQVAFKFKYSITVNDIYESKICPTDFKNVQR